MIGSDYGAADYCFFRSFILLLIFVPSLFPFISRTSLYIEILPTNPAAKQYGKKYKSWIHLNFPKIPLNSRLNLKF